MNDSLLVLCVGLDDAVVRGLDDSLAGSSDRFAVTGEPTASGGYDRLADGDVDCVVGAPRLPDADGLSFLDSVRGDHSDLPFVRVVEDSATAGEAIAAGATDYFEAGEAVDSALLANRVRNTVERHWATERAATLERIRTLVNDVNQALVRASSREEIDARVCEIISASGPYRFAWISEVDPETDRLEPRERAGAEEGYLDAITVTADDTATGQGPGGTAIREERVAVVQDVQTDPSFEPWREEAIEQGYQSLAAVPLMYGGTRHGVLAVYADRSHAFDDEERELLAELGGDIAHALHAIETRDRLAREKERFRRLVSEVSEYAILQLDADGNVVNWNEGARRLKGYTGEEIVGEHVSAYYPPDERDTRPDEVLSAAAEQGSYEVEGWRVRKDGSRFWAQVTVTALRDDDGELEGFSKIVRDTTERRSREQKLRRFERAVEAAGQGIYITDTDGTIEYVNPAFEEITGYSQSDALGMTPRILKSGEMDEEYYERLWSTLLDGEVWEAEVIDRRKHGDTYEAYQTIAPIVDEDGDAQAFVAIQADITERKERESELRLKTRAIEESPIGTVITDPGREDNPIIYANESFSSITGYDEAEVVGRNCRFLQGEATDPDSVATMRDAIDQQVPVTVELRNYRKDGTEFWNRVTIAPVTDDAGRLTHYVGFQQDVTDRKERQQQLQVLDRVLRHNLNNDLNVIQARAEKIRADGPDSVTGPADVILDKTAGLAELVDKERAITQALSATADRIRIELGPLLDNAIEAITADHPAASVEVEGRTDVSVQATTQLDRALEELLENAIVHNDRPAPEVTVEVAVEDDTVRIDIADDGPGIPEMERDVLLGREDLDPLYHGSGLGLWLVYWIVYQSGGTLGFADNNSRGSVVAVCLPRPDE